MLPEMISSIPDFSLFVPEIIRDEVERNLPDNLAKDFYRLISSSHKIIFGPLYTVSRELFEKYCSKEGLKTGDALIAAFAESCQADILVSDNRDIYEKLQVDAFLTMTAKQFLSTYYKGTIWQEIHKLRQRELSR